jgi:glucosamine-6-phosphate deaminase
MEVIIRKTKEDASSLAAQLIAKAIREKPHIVLGLATGRTMEPLYARLVKLHREESLDFSLVRTFNLDEYAGLPADHPGSYRYYMNRHLHNHVNIDRRNTHLPDGMAADIDSECRCYEQKIRECAGIDLQLLGIGRAGHIGFNEPLSSIASRTRVIALTPTTISENSGQFANPAEMPRRAITMGVGTILESRRLLVLATGESKAEVLAKTVEGPITSRVTATAVQMHPHCTVICDEPAASLLEDKDYYRWIFENEPHWAPYR